MPSVRARLLRLIVRHKIASVFAPDVPIEERRRRVRKMTDGTPLIAGMVAEDGQMGGCDVTWVEPEDEALRASGPVLLHLHGGAFVVGSPRTHMFMPARLALGAGMRLLLPAYGLAPENPYPAAPQDVVRVYEALLAALPDGHAVVLSGDSAGGLVALQALLALREAGVPLPIATLLFSPLADVRDFDGESYTSAEKDDPMFDRDTLATFAKLYTVDADPSDPALCPKRADLTGLPPMRIDVGEHEVLRSDAEDLAVRAEACGVSASVHCEPGLWHGYAGWVPLLPEADTAIARNVDWLRTQLARR